MTPQSDFRTPFGSGGPSGPMFSLEQLPIAPNQQHRLLSGADPSPVASRTQSPRPPPIPNQPLLSAHTSPLSQPGAQPLPPHPDHQTLPDNKQASEAEQLLYAAAQAVLYNHALAESSSVNEPSINGEPSGLHRLAIRQLPDGGNQTPKPDAFYPPNPGELFAPPPDVMQHAPGTLPPNPAPTGEEMPGAAPLTVGGLGANHYPFNLSTRLPPIFQVEKKQVTTTATQAASESRRRNQAAFFCPVPGCGSTFTRRFNLRGHLRSHTEERPYVCEFPGCNKGFARQHDCKRHQALHTAKSANNVCQGCKKTFSRMDALNRHLRSENGSDCRQKMQQTKQLPTKPEPPSADAAAPTVEPGRI